MNNLTNNESVNLLHLAAELRKNIIKSLHAAGGGHFGGALSVADILLVLYKYVLDINAKTVKSRIRNRLIFSKGHAAISLYQVLGLMGILEIPQLINYGKFNANLEGHPDMLKTAGVDFSSGSLGQGLSVGLGMALGLKKYNKSVWVILGDGECQEGQIWEAAMLAARYNINNLKVIIDSNGAQEYGYKHNPNVAQQPVTNIEEKWLAFGWQVLTVAGHDHASLKEVFLACQENKNTKPTVIIANTKKGYGVKMFEQNPEQYHCATLTELELTHALQEVTHHE